MAVEEAIEVRDLIPKSMIKAVQSLAAGTGQLETHLLDFLSLCDTDVLSEMPPLQRAEIFLAAAKSATILFSVRLQCSGIDPKEHSISSEIARLQLYEDKLERHVSLSKETSRQPSMTLNQQAAARVIQHSLPDLTQEQRRGLRDISKRERTRIDHLEKIVKKKQRQHNSERESAQARADEFLQKAACELGIDATGLKGPIRF